MHNFFIKSIVFPYMFRALLCSSSGGLNLYPTAFKFFFVLPVRSFSRDSPLTAL